MVRVLKKAALSPGNTLAPHSPRCSRAALQNASELLRHDCHGIAWHILQYLINDMIGGDALGFGFEIEDQAMAHGCRRGGLNIIEADVETALGERAHFARED